MMTTPEVRNQVVNDITLAINNGARQRPACELMGIAVTTLKRWKPAEAEAVRIDQRPTAIRQYSANPGLAK